MAGTFRGWREARDGFVGAVAVAGLCTGLALSPAAHGEPAPSPTPSPTSSTSGGAQAASTPTETSTGSAAAASGSGSTAVPAAASGDVLDQLAEEYAVGSGGGQLSNLLKMSLKLRAMGFKPSKANLAEIAQAMDYRPNQIPLIEALKDAIAYQQKIRAQMEILQQYQQRQGNSAVMGAGQMPGDSNPANIPGAPPAAAAAPPMPAAPAP